MPNLPITSCAACPAGRAAGVGRGGRCLLVDRRRDRDDVVCLEGYAADTIWFVKKGTVLVSRAGADGIDRPRAVRGPGTFVGLEALIRPTYADSARTTEPSILCGASRDDFDAWLGPAGTPARMALEQTLLATTADPSRAASADGSAIRRVARWLLDAGAAGPPRLPRHVVASLLGMAPETLSRALAGLRDHGAIAVTPRGLQIEDRARLVRFAQPLREATP